MQMAFAAMLIDAAHPALEQSQVAFNRIPYSLLRHRDRNPFLAARHQVSGLKPIVQFRMATLENRADSDREFALARTTTPQTGTTPLRGIRISDVGP
jgi:hypothetical protein